MTTLKHAHRGVVIGAGLYLVAVFGYCAYNYATTRAGLLKELDHRLMVGARATLLLADEHVSRPNPLEVMGESAYMAMLLRMNAYIEEANLDFIYTMAEEDGVIYFTASTFSEEDAEENNFTPSEYVDASPELRECFESGEIIFEDYTDSEGYYRSAFIPARNADGKIYVAAADLKISDIQALLRQDLLRNAGLGVLFIGFFTPLLLAIRRLTRAIGHFTQTEIRQQTQEIKNLNEELEQRIDEAERGRARATQFAEEAKVAREASEQARAQGMAEAAGVLSEIVDKSVRINDALKGDVGGVMSGAEGQRARIMETASAMIELNATAASIAKTASNTADTAADADRTAERGESAVVAMAEAIQALQLSAEVTSEGLDKLAKHAEGIGHIMTIISDIADQTNLLALNASIEAARAGDAGRGFTVVAEEVRKLAEKTTTATRSVKEAVAEIQSETRNSVDTMEMTARAVDEAMVLSQKTGSALVEIRETVGRSANHIREIAAASEQQSVTFDHVVQSNEEVSRIAASSASRMEQASSSMDELSDQILQIDTLVQRLKQGGVAGP
ncbi:MAG: methyl-accepting chemotaxis protein [Acidobacteria bacterium]|nr:MAG: methyl-accepting chemotaxis protein [Acidobacteriota bacterium]